MIKTLKQQLIEKCEKKWFADFHKYYRVGDMEAQVDVLLYNYINDELPDDMSISEKIEKLFAFMNDVDAKRAYIQELSKHSKTDEREENEIELKRNIWTNRFIRDSFQKYLDMDTPAGKSISQIKDEHKKAIDLLKKVANSQLLKGPDDNMDYKVCAFLCKITHDKKFNRYSGTEKYFKK